MNPTYLDGRTYRHQMQANNAHVHRPPEVICLELKGYLRRVRGTVRAIAPHPNATNARKSNLHIIPTPIPAIAPALRGFLNKKIPVV